MIIFETRTFTRQITAILSDEEYRLLQLRLMLEPVAGAVIPGSGGLRKLRWGVQGRGKRGGVRVIYYWMTERRRILMLLAYSKTQIDDLTLTQVKMLRKLIEEEIR